MLHVRDSRAKKSGSAIASCPVCGKKVQIQMFEVYDSIHLICLPVGSFLQDYFAVCPECCSVFAVDRPAYIALKGGNGNFIKGEHMKVLVDGSKAPDEK